MIEIKAPKKHSHGDLFLAGGIPGTTDWQQQALELLTPVPGHAYNPRRAEPFVRDLQAEQTRWEYDALHAAKTILFWFVPETLNPMTLFELGVWCNTSKPLFVGVDPGYARAADVHIQMGLSRPGMKIYGTLAATVAAYASIVAADSTDGKVSR